MALKTYVGARYAPQFMGAWDKSSEYAALSVVYTNDRSFVSRKTVPANTEITNTDYWILSSDWNAQVTKYNQAVEEYNKNVEIYNQNVESYQKAISAFYADTLHAYRNKADMVADKSLRLNETVLTCGDKVIGDTAGSYYRVVANTSLKAVALDNGLFAEPFEIQPYSTFANDMTSKYNAFTENINTSVALMQKVSLHNYDNVEQMKADETLAADTTVITSGLNTIGDNLGRFYRVAETSDNVQAVELNNGKKAVPFNVNVGYAEGNAAIGYANLQSVPTLFNTWAGVDMVIETSAGFSYPYTTFVAIMYSNNDSTTTNFTIKTPNGQTKKVTVTDSGKYKTVIYAIDALLSFSGELKCSITPITSWNSNPA